MHGFHGVGVGRGRTALRSAGALVGLIAVGVFGPTAAQAHPAAPIPIAAPAVSVAPAHFSGFSLGRDVVSSAQPTDAELQVIDVQSGRLLIGGDDKADSVATASSSCDGCDAQAITAALVLSRSRHGSVRADNIATAWSSCVGCSSTAVAVQVVSARSADDVHVNNRALAVNTVCDKCTTTAVAVQYVLVGSQRGRPQIDPRQQADAIAKQIADQAAAAAAQANSPSLAPQAQIDSRAAVDSIVDQGRTALQQQLSNGGTVQVNVDFKSAG